MNKNEGRERTKGKKGIAFITDDGNRLSGYLKKMSFDWRNNFSA